MKNPEPHITHSVNQRNERNLKDHLHQSVDSFKFKNYLKQVDDSLNIMIRASKGSLR